MANPAAARQGDRGAGGPTQTADFDELRALIVGPEQRQLRTIQTRLDDPAMRTRDVSRVLPQAMLLRKDDPQLTRALAPTIEEAITTSVRRNPRPLADALFPIFGPAIRKAIAASLNGMVESLNRTLEHSLSWRALQWRITALRTGKSFAEIVLLNTLVYRVEQVFLIERDSGLLLLHVTAGASGVRDADMVSGMLTAIRDFARDSFRVTDDAALDALKVGDLSVWIEQGPHAILAVVVRGAAPPELRTSMQEAIEHVHARFGDKLAQFDGDSAPFESARPALEGLLQSRYRSDRRKSRPMVWVLAGALVVAFIVWSALTLVQRARFDAYIEALRREPGIVVVSSQRRGGRLIVNGMRDPLARDPASLVASANLADGDVTGNWQLYQALEPPFIAERARQLLRAPADVKLTFSDGVLTAGGNAPVDWIRESFRVWNFVPTVKRYDAGALIESELRRLGSQLEARPLIYTRGSTELEPESQRHLDAALRDIAAINELAEMVARRARIEITGHADSDGPPESNDPLSLSRATRVRDLIAAQRYARLDLTASGAGSRQPLTVDGNEAAKRKNRRVTLRLVPSS